MVSIPLICSQPCVGFMARSSWHLDCIEEDVTWQSCLVEPSEMDSQLGTDTIGKTLSGRKYLMTFSENQASFEKLLGKQLHGFSQLSKALVLRLVQLEERVARLESSQSLIDDGCQEVTKSLLVDSQERVRPLQGLLDVDPDR